MRERILGVFGSEEEIMDQTKKRKFLLQKDERTGKIKIALQTKHPDSKIGRWFEVMSVQDTNGYTAMTVNALLPDFQKGLRHMTQAHYYGPDGDRKKDLRQDLAESDNPLQEWRDLTHLDLFFFDGELPDELDIEATIEAFLKQVETGDFKRPLLIPKQADLLPT